MDIITKVVNDTKKRAQDAQNKVDAARLSGELSARDKREIDTEIEKFSVKDSSGAVNTEKRDARLRQYEEELEFNVSTKVGIVEKAGTRATDEEKRQMFDALNRLEYVSKKLGPDSPAKKAAKAAIAAAEA